MKLLLAVATTISIASCVIGLAAGNAEVQYGSYVCVSDRTVGFTDHGGERFAGRINLPPEEKAFFVTIRPIQEARGMELGTDWLVTRDGWVKHNRDWCFSSRATEKLQREWENGGKAATDLSGGASESDFHDQCLATSQLKLKVGDSPDVSYYAIGKNAFTSFLGQTFNIGSSGSFRWLFTDLYGGWYLSEGRCNLVR